MWTHTWDHLSRLLNSTDGTDTVSYTYDEGGQRVQRTAADGEVTTYVSKNFELDDEETRTFVYLGQMKVATKTTDLNPPSQ